MPESSPLHYKEEGARYKIRVGVYPSRTEAERALRDIKKKYTDAYIVAENGDSFQTRGVDSFDFPQEPAAASPYGRYKVQLAAYRDTRWFDESLVSDLGVIEERPKGDFVVKYVSGFENLPEAQEALRKAKAAGFNTAFIVEELNGGNLRKIN